MPVYAAPEDFFDPPESVESQIRLASRLVEDATVTAFYRADADGMPVDEDVRDLFKAATIAQVEYWARLDIDPAQGEAGVTQKREVSSKSIGSASLAYESSERSMSDRLASLTTLGPDALAILGSLARGRVIVRG